MNCIPFLKHVSWGEVLLGLMRSEILMCIATPISLLHMLMHATCTITSGILCLFFVQLISSAIGHQLQHTLDYC